MDRLDSMLLEWEDRRHRGERVTADDLCPDDPVLRQKLAETISLVVAFESLMSAEAQPAPRIPERIGKYEVRRILGVGGMGVVYAAWDPVLARTVAVKVIQPRRDPDAARRAAERFLREGQLLAKFGRKSIVAALDAGEQDGVPYLVMDYLPGGSLAARQEELTAAGRRAVVPLVVKVARAVQDAHDAGVLHRDLKPGNVLLDEKGDPFVADFGLASIIASEDSEAGHAGATGPSEATTLSAVGTPAYMAPEQWDPIYGPV